MCVLRRLTLFVAGTGAGIDSFYEYMFKAAVMFHDDDFLQMYHSSRDAVNKVRGPCVVCLQPPAVPCFRGVAGM